MTSLLAASALAVPTPEVSTTTAYLIVGIVGAVLLLAGGIYTARSSRRATEDTNAITAMKVLLEEYRGDWRKTMADLRETEGRVDTLEGTTRTLRSDLESSTRVLRVALSYVQELRAEWMKAVPGGTPPPIPHELTDHLPTQDPPAST